MKKFLFFLGVAVFFLVVYALNSTFVGSFFEKKEIQMTSEVLIENKSDKEDETKTGLYVKSFLDDEGISRKLFFALDTLEYKSLNNKNVEENFDVKKLHVHDFWDPKKCSQMISVVGSDFIVFSDSFIEVYGEKDFRTYVFFYNIEKNILTSTQINIPIQKMFYKNGDYFALSKNKSDNIWKLYKIDTANKRLSLIKKYDKNLTLKEFSVDFTESKLELITATSSLSWCDAFNDVCVTDSEFDFGRVQTDLTKEKSQNNPFELKVLHKNLEVLRLKKSDFLRSYILGVSEK